MDTLIEKLSHGDQPVSAKRYKSCADLREAIARQFVLIQFTDTQGGTEVGVRLEDRLTNLAGASFSEGIGCLELGGTLTLNYTPVEFRARIDLSSLTGTGNLRLVKNSP